MTSIDSEITTIFISNQRPTKLGYNLKALHYCGTHPNAFLKQNCRNCGQGMCSSCIETHPHFCPECQLELKLMGTTRNAGRESFFMTLSGLIVVSLFLLFAYLEEFNNHPNFIWYLLLAFLVGISFVGTYYYLKDKNFVSDLWNLPFNGAKFSIYAILLVFVSCVPIGYYFYQLFTYLIRIVRGKKY